MFNTHAGGRPVGAFYCPVCDVNCSDAHAAERHRASLRHKKKSGEFEAERRTYKDDASVTAEDIMALVERKRVELGVIPWSQLRVNDEKNKKEEEEEEKKETAMA
ncbi:zinc finger protein [Trypanosoma melophagium]|uniref:zinc finger protein n=1 Tax=Trypanosoma melophagium TaxID=715481 RepID=UPI00351A44DC|nr:zinc finger protein [Trypanosoma melophagium]